MYVFLLNPSQRLILLHSRFKANYFNRPTEEDIQRGVKRHEMPRSIKKIHVPLPKVIKEYSNGHHHGPSLPELEQQYSQPIDQTDVDEVWFAGVHCGTSQPIQNQPTRNMLNITQTLAVVPWKTAPVTVLRVFRYGG